MTKLVATMVCGVLGLALFLDMAYVVGTDRQAQEDAKAWAAACESSEAHAKWMAGRD